MKSPIPNKTTLQKAFVFLAPSFWFLLGFSIAAITVASAVIIYFQQTYKDKVIPGIFVEDTYIGEKSREEIAAIFDAKNKTIQTSQFIFSHETTHATVSAEKLHIGYDTKLITEQALSLGKSPNIISDMMIIIDAYLNGTSVEPSYTFNTNELKTYIEPIDTLIYKEPVDAQFTVTNGKVTTFTESQDGKSVHYDALLNTLENQIAQLVKSKKAQTLYITIPVTILEPKVTTEKANDLGIVEVIGQGKSYFAGSIPNRIFNLTHAASKINGTLIEPNQIFSFNQTIGDISKATGYKEAYVISGGKTILGDGGGVCQVSTTLFRAALNTGLPIKERNAHTYRVGYYEQQFPPGLDAAIYVPTVDFKFSNDTGRHILIQSFVNNADMSITFTLYGTRDGREVSMTSPVVTSQSPAPEPHYQDDPNLPMGQVQQVEYAASGAVVTFNRTVTRDGKVHIQDSFTTRYTPWRAVFLRGTKQG